MSRTAKMMSALPAQPMGLKHSPKASHTQSMESTGSSSEVTTVCTRLMRFRASASQT